MGLGQYDSIGEYCGSHNSSSCTWGTNFAFLAIMDYMCYNKTYLGLAHTFDNILENSYLRNLSGVYICKKNTNVFSN